MLKEKEHESFISKIAEKAGKIVITKIPNERGAETKLISEISREHISDVETIEDYKEAFDYVKTLNKPVCVTGSIYLVGLIKEYLKN